MSASEHPFHRLTPAFVMDAVESRGYRCDCRTLALNSYENRVYQVGIEEGQPLIAKFYRPGRWSDAQIIEEHDFSRELAEHELPVVAPLADEGNNTLSYFDGFRFALYPRKGGHAPEFDNLDNLLIMGRLLGRMHRIGALRPFDHRPQLTSADFGHAAAEWIGEHFIPGEYRDNYRALTRDLLQEVDQLMAEVAPRFIRTHGDCHAGNVLWRDDAPHLVDLDDARMAPAVQDIWMMLSGERPRQLAQLSEIVEGYNEFHSFHPAELRLIEALRSLRIIHHCAWLAQRWKDPAFPTAFPWFNTPRFWDGHILELREQIAALHEPPLQLI
ncbi:MAG: serine/threonine protein kinase [Thermodesulfobacteriota bacterium]|jgi:Ser/Thr protein kinase RdoA (MazF antagonist)|nr:serine/threonine protein kinase [Thermodesulfobacteriota bacterium]